MRMEFDERRLKQMAAVKWRLAPEEWPVKVVLLARGRGCRERVRDTTEVCSGENAGGNGSSGSEAPSWRRERLCCGLGGWRIGREFALRGYTQYPGGQRCDGQGVYPSGLGVPQW